MGALTVMFAIRRYGIPDTVVISLVTSSIMLGMKLDKLSLLKHWCAIASLLIFLPACTGCHYLSY
jgi:hypothetical protein